LWAESALELCHRTIVGWDFLQQCLNLWVGVELRCLLLEDQVGAHTAASEVLHALVILGAVCVCIEVAAAIVANILKELDQEEGVLWVHRAEAEVLIVAAWVLVVQVDMEQLAGFPSLSNTVQEVETSHLLVSNLW